MAESLEGHVARLGQRLPRARGLAAVEQQPVAAAPERRVTGTPSSWPVLNVYSSKAASARVNAGAAQKSSSVARASSGGHAATGARRSGPSGPSGPHPSPARASAARRAGSGTVVPQLERELAEAPLARGPEPDRARSPWPSATGRAAPSSSAMPPPIELPATCGAGDPQLAEEALERRGERADGRLHLGWQRWRLAEAGHIRGDHVVALGQRPRHRAPHLPAESRSRGSGRAAGRRRAGGGSSGTSARAHLAELLRADRAGRRARTRA